MFLFMNFCLKVCSANSETKFDFAKDPIDCEIVHEVVTTLSFFFFYYYYSSSLLLLYSFYALCAFKQNGSNPFCVALS